MKIEGRRAQIKVALERGLDSGSLQELLDAGATAVEVKEVLAELKDGFSPALRKKAEQLLAQPTASSPSGKVAGGKRIVDVRAEKSAPWWKGVEGPDLGPLAFDAPPKDVVIGGAKLTKADLASLLKGVGRAS